jgi:hypothetical protein
LKELISVKEPPVTLLRSLLAELKHRDTAAALRLKEQIENEIRNRVDGKSSNDAGDNRKNSRQSSQDKPDYELIMNKLKKLQSQLKDSSERETSLSPKSRSYAPGFHRMTRCLAGST